jgi:uncharacterized protein
MNEDAVSAAEARIVAVIEARGPLAIAVSGGVDSMTLAHIAHRIAGTEMVHAMSPAVPAEATERVRRYAARFGWRLVTTSAAEFSDPDYLKNPVNRCFFCKTNLYERIASLTTLTIASGANLDDLSDYRPGLVAAAEHGVVHPLVEAKISKALVRQLARRHALTDLAELPAQPCLSSRIETGIAIDAGDLAFVHHVESRVRQTLSANADVRCRITRAGVVLELGPGEEADVTNAVQAARELTLQSGRIWADARPYRKGSAFIGIPGL